MSQQYGFSKENKGKVDSALDFPRLKLEKKGEKARLAIFGIGKNESGKAELVLPSPEGGYYFDLRIPGHEREYVGSFECLAPEAAKQAGEFDADACPHCEAVLGGKISEEVMRKRTRKMVLPVIRYKTNPTSSELVVPHSVEAVAWRFGDRYFNVLVDEHNKWESSKGLLGHDITLTCEAVQYQNFTISVEPEAAYAADRDLGKLVVETFINQTSTLENGLSRVLGSKLNAVDLARKIKETVEGAAQLGIGGPIADTIPTVDPATIENLAADLLGETTDVEVVQATAVTSEEPAEVTTPAAPEAEAELNFDDFFGS